ncbi:hypothetical protein EXIGUO8A_410009 [Exiguobacterium sp. 8A]|uniref:TM2 domain-containing protein n=1 Tax=Exiguobacterium sp. 8A TaxID=2653139 RepID=UPI0012F2BD26|nr:TM2 domain-containing protein [Exiguobacterium sp. 8A]VXB97715.1 hypothetical protein EXIGUO8A_410009 [Exiguobacterium sp. 8A]
MKLKTDAYLLHTFFGIFGAGRFYVGDIKLGLFSLFSLGGFGLFWLCDFFLLSRRVEQVNAINEAIFSYGNTSHASIHSDLLTEFKRSHTSISIIPSEAFKPETQESIS